jgi:hypothetical protein
MFGLVWRLDVDGDQGVSSFRAQRLLDVVADFVRLAN